MSGPSLEKAPPRRSSRHLFKLFLIYLGLGLACAWASQWLPDAEGAKRVATRIWGPVLTDSYPSTGRDQITVMLIDDKDLREYGEAWPVSLGFHERRLLELLKYQPKAVFFDIVFLDDRKDPGLDGFVDAACKARQAGVPVFVGSFGNLGYAPSRTERAMLGRRIDVGGASLPCIEPAYLNMRIDSYDQSVWEYDLDVPPQGAATASAGASFPSPAARLFKVDHVLDRALATEPMALVWGTASDPRNLEWLNSDLRPGGPGAPCASTWRLWRVLNLGKPGDPICPYQQLLPIRTLKRTHGLDAQDLGEAIRGKYLIYGTHLQSNGDVILSPYHGRIAGAFLHAMALDNLLSFAGRPKAGGDFGQPWLGAASAFTLFAVAAISALIVAKQAFDLPARFDRIARWLLSRWHPGQRPSPPGWRRVPGQSGLALKRLARSAIGFVLMASMYLAVVTLLVLVSYHVLDLGPLVWIEFALFPIGVEFLDLATRLEKWTASLSHYWHGFVGAINADDPPQAVAPQNAPNEEMRLTGTDAG